jgi:hypothetical protein
MYFPLNWEFGSALSKLRNFGGGGDGLNPPKPAPFGTPSYANTTQASAEQDPFGPYIDTNVLMQITGTTNGNTAQRWACLLCGVAAVMCAYTGRVIRSSNILRLLTFVLEVRVNSTWNTGWTLTSLMMAPSCRTHVAVGTWYCALRCFIVFELEHFIGFLKNMEYKVKVRVCCEVCTNHLNAMWSSCKIGECCTWWFVQ